MDDARSLRVPLASGRWVLVFAVLVAAVAVLVVGLSGVAAQSDSGVIVFSSDADGDYDLWTVPASGGSATQLADLVTEDRNAHWSPDGSKIAFIKNPNTTNGRLWVMNADGSGATQIASIQARFAPAWSPDGSQIAFAGNSGDGDFDLHVIAPDGSGLAKVADTSDHEEDATWVDSGIAVVRGSNVVIVDPATGADVASFPAGSVRHLDGSPDGNSVAMSQFASGGFRLAILDLATGTITGVTDGTASDVGPSWSPDGMQLAFSRGPSGSRNIYIIGVDGTGLTQVTSSTANDTGPDWFGLVAPPPSLVEIHITEGVGVADQVQVLPPVEITITEGIGVGDQVAVNPPVQIHIAEGIGVSDVVAVNPPVVIEIFEQVGVGDSTVVNPPVQVEISEAVGVRDDVTVTLIQLVDVATTDLVPGDETEFSGDGFAPGSDIDIGIESEFCLIDTTTADSAGAFSVTVTIPTPGDCPDGLTAGPHTLVAVGVNPDWVPYEVHAPFTLRAPVEVTLLPTNPTAAPVDTTFTLGAIFADDPGALTSEVMDPADATIVLEPVGPGSTELPDFCTADDLDVGVHLVECTFTGVPVNTYVVAASIDDGLFLGRDESVFTVADPSLGFTTGGGWFYWPGTGERTNFGFTIKHNRKGTNVKGSFVLIRKFDDGTIYRVKSNALDGLAIGADDDPPWATFSGKATYLAPSMEEPEGNYSFVVYVEDDPDGDRFWLEARDKDGAVIEATSMLAPASGNAVGLAGGDIAVPHSTTRREPTRQ